MKQLFLIIGLLLITTNVFAQSGLTEKQLKKRRYKEIELRPASLNDETVMSLLKLLEDTTEVKPAKAPMYPHGAKGIRNDVFAKIKYPEDALTFGLKGTVYSYFTIAKNGKLKDIIILKSTDGELQEEVIRVLKTLKLFEPARDDKGEPMEVKCFFPITFHL